MLDNTKYYNDTLAYDFEMFMEHPKKEKPDNIVKMKVSSKRKERAKPKSILIFVALGAVLLYCCLGIKMRVTANEINAEISSVQNQIRELKAEKTRLEMQMEQIISYENISEKAKELGMTKAKSSQIKYIRTETKNKAIDKNGKEMISAE